MINKLIRLFHQNNSDSEEFAALQRRIQFVKAEQEEGVHRWYNADTGAFIAQGPSDDIMLEVLRQEWPDSIFVLQYRYFIIGPNFDVVHDLDELNGD